jgi:hypothetical protein
MAALAAEHGPAWTAWVAWDMVFAWTVCMDSVCMDRLCGIDCMDWYLHVTWFTQHAFENIPGGVL